jgi:hypothetical protein
MTMTYNYAYGSTTYSINEQKEGKLKNRPLHEVLTLFGQHGWELVSMGGADGKTFVFKRHSTNQLQAQEPESLPES